MNNNLLPLGTVVLLKNATKKLFIAGYGVNDNETKKLFDYIGYSYPEGFIDPKLNFVFNKEDIDKVVYEGYKDKEFDAVDKNITKYINDKRNNKNE